MTASFELDLLDLWARFQDALTRAPGTYTGPVLPDDPVMAYRYLDACRDSYSRVVR